MCTIVPGSLTVRVSECDPATGLYSISGEVDVINPPGQISSGTTGYAVFGTTCSGGGSSPYVATGPFPDIAIVTVSYTINNLIANGVSGCILSVQFYDNTFPTNNLDPVVVCSAELEFNAAEPCFTEFLYYEFTSCCNPEETIAFNPGEDPFVIITPGTYLYTGPAYQGLLPNTCYTIAEAFTTNSAFFTNLPNVPLNIPANYTEALDCNDTLVCPGCEVNCYRLYSCDGTSLPFNTHTNLSAYVGQFIEISLVDQPSIGCFFVQETDANDCSDAVDIEVISTGCTCECLCYTILGSVKKLQYLTCDNQIVKDPTKNQFCSRIYPVVSGTPGEYQINQGLPCIDGECPEVCYLLTNCQTGETITTQNNLSQYYLNNQVVVIVGQEGCWEIEIAEECDCPQEVIVAQFYDDCPSCIPPVAYKLINCTTQQVQFYTTTDLSLYVGKTVEIDCGCYLVEQINIVPPTDTPIVVDFIFDDCDACEAVYYRLQDCFNPLNIIYTRTDLSLYVNEVIKIKNCDNCWQVTETRIFTTLESVEVLQDFLTCEDCYVDAPCTCTKVTNLTTEIQTFSYIDCENDEVELTLAINETSNKVCAKRWILPDLPDGQFLYQETFGECKFGICPQPTFKNNRTVRPGYNTPICTAAKYDEITCRFADIIYKIALEKRYGITNCCPDDDEKWVSRKELIDLQALKDPNYSCKECECSCTSENRYGSGNTCTTCNCKN
jgi:hypothetical protein